jgi:hypothetical protein
MLFRPMPLTRRPEPFSHPDWLFEAKWDEFRRFAYIEHGLGKLCRATATNTVVAHCS